MIRRGTLYKVVIGGILCLALGCGGGGEAQTNEEKLVGQWVAEKLNGRGDRLLMTLGGEGSLKPVTITTIPISEEPRLISSGTYRIEESKITFTLSGIGTVLSPFTVSENRLILGTESYDRLAGSLEGSQIGGQVKISEEAGHRSIRVTSGRDFVPGEILVKYRNGTFGMIILKPEESPPPALTIPHDREAGDLTSLSFHVMERKEQVQNRLIDRTLKIIEELNEGSRSAHSALRTSGQWEADLEWAIPNAVLRLQSLPSDPLFVDQWNLSLLDVTNTWTQATPSPSAKQVVVAVIDSGIVRGHPDLEDRILFHQGYDFTSHKAYDPDAKKTIDDLDMDGTPGPDSDPTDPGDLHKVGFKGSNSSWHGSHLAGIIAANTNNKLGIAGMTPPNVKILPIRVAGYKGIITLYDLAQAISYAVHLPNIADCQYTSSEKESITSYKIKRDTCQNPNDLKHPKADIINLSLAGDISVDKAKPLIDVIDDATKAGVLIVAAAGNSHRRVTDENPVYPASDSRVLAVGSVCPNLAFAASYSNFGQNQFLVAPGGCGSSNILGTIETNVQNGYGALHGTSQAAAHVTAVAAMIVSELKSRSVTTSPSEIRTILKETAIDLGDSGWDDSYGYGLVNACGAVVKARGGAATGAAMLRLSSEAVDLGALGISHTVIVTSGCGGVPVSGISVSKKTDNGGNWLDVNLSGTEVPARAVIKVDRSKMSQGAYSGTVTIQSSGGSKIVQIKMTVGPRSSLSEEDKLLKEIEEYLAKKETSESERFFNNKIDVGEVLIELVDPTTRQPKSYLTTDFRSNYYFQFVRVPQGKYGVQAGIDENRDGKICQKDEDEPCFVYGTKSELTVVEVSPPPNFTKKNDLVLNY